MELNNLTEGELRKMFYKKAYERRMKKINEDEDLKKKHNKYYNERAKLYYQRNREKILAKIKEKKLKEKAEQ